MERDLLREWLLADGAIRDVLAEVAKSLPKADLARHARRTPADATSEGLLKEVCLGELARRGVHRRALCPGVFCDTGETKGFMPAGAMEQPDYPFVKSTLMMEYPVRGLCIQSPLKTYEHEPPWDRSLRGPLEKVSVPVGLVADWHGNALQLTFVTEKLRELCIRERCNVSYGANSHHYFLDPQRQCLTGLRCLTVVNFPIDTEFIENLPCLEELSLRNVDIRSNEHLGRLTRLRRLNLVSSRAFASYGALVIVLTDLTRLEHIHVSLPGSAVELSPLAPLMGIKIGECMIDNFRVTPHYSKFPSLTSLRLSGGGDPRGLTALRTLHIKRAELKALLAMPFLQNLHVEELPAGLHFLSGLRELKIMSIRDNPLAELPPLLERLDAPVQSRWETLTALRVLTLTGYWGKPLYLGHLTRLEKLRLDGYSSRFFTLFPQSVRTLHYSGMFDEILGLSRLEKLSTICSPEGVRVLASLPALRVLRVTGYGESEVLTSKENRAYLLECNRLAVTRGVEVHYEH
jgi:hypothetical protein